MTAIYLPGVVSIIPHYDTAHGKDAVNVIQFTTEVTGLTAGQLAGAQTAFNTTWASHWSALATTANHYLGCWVIDQGSALGQQVTNVGYTPVAGTGVGIPVGDNVAALISLKGATRYKGGHGRVYIPGLDNSRTNDDGATLTSATTTSILGMWNAMATAMESLSSTAAGPLTPVIWHKKWAAHPNTTEPVLNVIAQSLLATQRRRLRKPARRIKSRHPVP